MIVVVGDTQYADMALIIMMMIHMGGNGYDDDFQAPLHGGRSACSPNAGPQ